MYWQATALRETVKIVDSIRHDVPQVLLIFALGEEKWRCKMSKQDKICRTGPFTLRKRHKPVLNCVERAKTKEEAVRNKGRETRNCERRVCEADGL